GATSQSFTITVGMSNGLPFFTSSPVETAYLGKPYSYVMSAYNSSGNPLGFTLASSAPSWLTLVDDGNGYATLSGTPTGFETNSSSITVTVTDGVNLVDQTYDLTTSSGWWANGEHLGSNWVRLSWLGLVNLASPYWIYHEQLGWIYLSGTSPSSVWIWVPGVGWLWTSDTTYPYLFDYSNGDWSYFKYLDSTAKRYLYRFSTGNWSEF
ncbi:MAG: Ig domain-containing protein, partial [Opitutales bacterium]